MKTHTIKTPTELLIVELPIKSDVEIFPDSIEIYNQFTGQEETIKGSYTLLGKPDEIKEEDIRELVEKKGRYYKNYSPIYGSVQGNITFTALESFNSALESEIHWENPVSLEREKVYRRIGNTFTADGILKCWHEAQEKTFDKNRTLILKKT